MQVRSTLKRACRQAAEKHQAIMASGSSLCVCHKYITDQSDRQSTAHSASLRAHLADGLLHFVEMGGLVEVAGHHLGQQRRQHIREGEQDQTPDRLRMPSKPR
jgi:hypothetical protein